MLYVVKEGVTGVIGCSTGTNPKNREVFAVYFSWKKAQEGLESESGMRW